MTQSPELAVRRPLDRDRSVVALGVALLATAVVVSTRYTRDRGDLDWSNLLVGLLATAGLLGIAVLSDARGRGDDRATDLVAWPGAFGVGGVGLMITVLLDDHDATAYVAGLVVLVLGVGGVVLTRRGPFVVAAVLGGAVAYVRLLEDLLDSDDPSGVPGVRIALGLTVFAVLATAACWLRPESRVLGGAVAGGLTVVGFAGLGGVLAINSSLFIPLDLPGMAFTGGPSSEVDYLGDGMPLEGTSSDWSMSFADYTGPGESNPFASDAWTILVLALLLVVAWCVCAAVTGHVAYRLLAVAVSVSVTPLVMQVLLVDHPTWWGVVAAAAGGAVLVAALARARTTPTS